MPKPRVKRHAVTQPLDPSYRLIPLTRGQNAIVDTADFEWLSQWNWYARWNSSGHTFYACRHCYPNGVMQELHMARVILGCSPDKEPDHRNRNSLDNRRANLRECTHVENTWNRRKRPNRTGFKGVTWIQTRRRWVVSIKVDRKRIFIGRFTSLEQAARAYDEAAKKYRGEFAQFNFPS